MVGGRITLLLVASLAAPAAVMPPPLHTTPDPAALARLEARSLTQLGIAGKRVYDAKCVQCHGYDARGTERGPSLRLRIYWRENLDKRDFHRAVSEGVPAQRWSFGAMPPAPELSFNEVEFVARYVHEIQRPDLFRNR